MKALYAKLLALQNELGAISKDEENPFFKSKYFDINGLIKHVKPLLATHGLILVQPLGVSEGKNTLTTILVDATSGEQLSSVVFLPEERDPQKMGSAITYFRRYAIQSLLLLNAEDDDGNAAKPVQTMQKPAQKQAMPTQSSFGPFVLDGYEYITGISQKTNKPWYAKQVVGTKDKEWLQAFDYDQAYSNYRSAKPTQESSFDDLGEERPDDLPF
jgi:hypothetical protein